jgi:hypothetical protein
VEGEITMNDTTRRICAVALALVITTSAGIAAEEAEPPAMKRVVNPDGAFTVQLPKNWRVRQEGMTLEAASPDTTATASIAARQKEAQSVGELATNTAERWVKGYADWTEIARGRLEVSGHPAMMVRARGTTGGEPMALIHLLALSDEREVTMTLACPRVAFGRWQETFGRIGDSLRIGTPEEPGLTPTERPLPAEGEAEAEAEAEAEPEPAEEPEPGPAAEEPEPEPAPPPPPPPPPQRVREPDGLFALTLPPDWTVKRTPGRVDAQDPTGRARLVAAAAPRKAGSLDDFADRWAGFCEKTVRAWTQLSRRKTTVSGRDALHIRAVGLPQGQHTVGHYWLLLTPEHEVSLTCVCPAEIEPRWRRVFLRIAVRASVPAEPPEPAAAPEPEPTAEPSAPRPRAQLRRVSDPGGAFELALPSDWTMQQQPGGLLATAPSRQASVMVLAAPRTAEDLRAFAQAYTRQMSRQVPEWRALGRWRVEVGERQGIHVRATSRPGGTPTVGDTYLVVTEDSQVTLTLTCHQERAPRWRALFRRIAAAFRVP